MTEKEQQDLIELRSATVQKKESLYSYLLTIERASEQELVHLGYRNMSKESAMRIAFQSFHKQVCQLAAAHVRKYPD